MRTSALFVFVLCGMARVSCLHGQSVQYSFTTLAGSAGTSGLIDGTNLAARFNSPGGIAVDSSGTLYVADILNQTIRKITSVGPDWVVTTIAGLAGAPPGSNDGTNTDARFYRPNGVAVNQAGTLFVADHYNHAIRMIVPEGTNWVVTTIAGLAGVSGSADGTNTDARFWSPTGIALDSNDRLYVADTANFAVREVEAVGTNWIVTTIAGSVTPGVPPTSGFFDGTNSDARFDFPYGITVDKNNRLFVADWGNSAIRQISSIGTNWVVTTIAGSDVMGTNDGPGLLATFNLPNDLRADASGNIYVTDQSNDTIRKLVPDGTNWIVSTIAGAAGHPGIADGLGTDARFKLPWGISVDTGGNLYVADYANQTIRKGTFVPVLQITPRSKSNFLLWPSAAATYSLETSTSLGATAVWLPLTNPPATNGLNLILSDPATVPSAFYRLHKL